MANNSKICQFCGKNITINTIKCPYCGEWLVATNKAQSCGIGFKNPIVIGVAVISLLCLLRIVLIGRGDSIFAYYFSFGMVGLGLYVYLLPSIIALSKKHPDFVPIFLANIFLGATGLVWLITLIWATKHRIGTF